jgi:hypothetical protein
MRLRTTPAAKLAGRLGMRLPATPAVQPLGTPHLRPFTAKLP